MSWSKLDAPVLGREWVGRRAICFLSGHAAEERLTGCEIITVEKLLALPRLAKASPGAQPTWDLNAADRVLRGFAPVEHERGRWLAALWDRTSRLMEQEWKPVEGIAAALLTHGTLEADALVDLLSGVIPLPLANAFAWSKSPTPGLARQPGAGARR